MAQVLFPVNFTKFKTTPPVAAFEFCRFRIFYSRFHFIYLKSFQVFFFLAGFAYALKSFYFLL